MREIDLLGYTTANIHDSKMAPVLLQNIKGQNVLFSAYDSQHIYKKAGTCNIFTINPINSHKDKQIENKGLEQSRSYV